MCTLGQAKKQKAETQTTLSSSWKEILTRYLKTFFFCYNKLRLKTKSKLSIESLLHKLTNILFSESDSININ